MWYPSLYVSWFAKQLTELKARLKLSNGVSGLMNICCVKFPCIKSTAVRQNGRIIVITVPSGLCLNIHTAAVNHEPKQATEYSARR